MSRVNFTRVACAGNASLDRSVKKVAIFEDFLLGMRSAEMMETSETHHYMARKLYIFNPTKRVKVVGAEPAKWVGGFSQTYAYLGDYQARMLGVASHTTAKKLPSWLHTQPEGAKNARGGASRTDRSHVGWG